MQESWALNTDSIIIHFDLQYPELDPVNAKVVNHADSLIRGLRVTILGDFHLILKTGLKYKNWSHPDFWMWYFDRSTQEARSFLRASVPISIPWAMAFFPAPESRPFSLFDGFVPNHRHRIAYFLSSWFDIYHRGVVVESSAPSCAMLVTHGYQNKKHFKPHPPLTDQLAAPSFPGLFECSHLDATPSLDSHKPPRVCVVLVACRWFLPRPPSMCSEAGPLGSLHGFTAIYYQY